MKTTYLTIALMLGVFAAPVVAASPVWDEAIALSAQDSKATLADLCNAVYKAAKEDPAKSPALLESVLAQRTNWNASQCYALLRSVLLALPGNVGCEIGTYTRKYYDTKGSAVKGEKVQRARYSAVISADSATETIFYSLLDALYMASLSEGVADNAVASLLPTVTGVYETASAAAAAEGYSETPILNDPLPFNGVIPTPGDTSPNN